MLWIRLYHFIIIIIIIIIIVVVVVVVFFFFFLIDPSQWTQLQCGLFSVPSSGPQLVYQKAVVCTVLSMEKCI